MKIQEQKKIDKTIKLLSRLIETPSVSGEEEKTADLLFDYLSAEGVNPERLHNNVWAYNMKYSADNPTVLMLSHHDTVEASHSYTMDPWKVHREGDRIYGLGSNDAGASLCAMLHVFVEFAKIKSLPVNLLFCAVAEEEISGAMGVTSILDRLNEVDFAIVGEPTGMKVAVAEKGLLVLDCTAQGVAGHAARGTGKNAISIAMNDIQWIENYEFAKVSPVLGAVKATTTQIAAGKVHNTIPDTCSFVVDVRNTDAYSHEEVIATMQKNMKSKIVPRSTRLKPSFIDQKHPMVEMFARQGCKVFGSPTMSDQALLSVPSLKVGPGMSERSHIANEYVTVQEIKHGLEVYGNVIADLMRNGFQSVRNS